MHQTLSWAAALGLLSLGVACSDSASTPMPPAPAQLRIIHASADAPAVDVTVNGSPVVSNAGFKAATAFQPVAPGTAQIRVNVAGTSTTALAAAPVLLSGRYYSVFALNTVSALEPLVIEDDGRAPDMGMVKVRVLHASPAVPAVDVYVTAPGADLATATPTLSGVAFKGFSSALQIPAATYQVRITASGAKSVAYDSGAVALEGGSDLLLAAVPQSEGASPVTLLGLTRNAASPKFEVVDNRALVRVLHASPDAPPVDVLVDGQTAVTGAAYTAASPYLPVTAGMREFKVNASGTSTTVIDVSPSLAAPKAYSVFAVGRLSSIEPLLVEDDLSAPAPGKAKLRAAHLSPDAPAVDVWVNGAKVLSNVPFKACSGYLEVPAGATDVQIALAGTTTIVLSGAMTLDAGGIYTAKALGTVAAVPGKPLQLSILKDK